MLVDESKTALFVLCFHIRLTVFWFWVITEREAQLSGNNKVGNRGKMIRKSHGHICSGCFSHFYKVW